MKRDTVQDIRRDFLDRVDGIEKKGDGWMVLCPSHAEKNPSLSVDEGEDSLLIHCFGGCPPEQVLQAIGWTKADLYPRKNGKVVPINRSKEEVKNAAKAEGYVGCTVAQYAEAKQLPEDWLKQEFNLSDLARHAKTKEPAVVMPYYGTDGREQAVRYRTALKKAKDGADLRFHWKTGAKAKTLLYGLERIEAIKEAGYVFMVEGESDVHTLRYHGIHALGVPGADNWKDQPLEPFEDIERVYAIVEQGKGGKTLQAALSNSPLRDKLRFVDLGEYDDPSGVHLAHPEHEEFKQVFGRATFDAVPFRDQEDAEHEELVQNLWEDCKELALNPNILSEFVIDLKQSGVVGVEREAKLLFLVGMTRFLERPSSVAVKGPSGAGKTHVTMMVLKFHPPDASYVLTAMSDRALAYSKQPLKHRHLVIYEASALEASDMLSYLLRSLLSEGHIRYEYVDPDIKETVVLEREGPTGLFITTTQEALHPENETRMLSFLIDDTKEQTQNIMQAEAARYGRDKPPEADLTRWHALGRWLHEAGDKKVEIPYARWLARKIPPIAVRLRRDFKQVLNLIAAHAILHQASRQRNEYGQIVATREDYRVVRGLLNDIISEQLEAAVPPTVRETVEALTRVYEEVETRSEGVSTKLLREELGNIDKAALSRRMKSAMRRGFVKNLEDKKGKPAKYAPADPLPKDVVVLPEAHDIPEEYFGEDRPGWAAEEEADRESRQRAAQEESVRSAEPRLPDYDAKVDEAAASVDAALEEFEKRTSKGTFLE